MSRRIISKSLDEASLMNQVKNSTVSAVISREGGEGKMIKSDASLALTPEQVRMVEENHNLIYGFMHKNNLCEEMCVQDFLL